MKNTYDVVIAGAGPAGTQCARDLGERNYDVVVLETEAEDEFPRTSNKSTAGTFPSTLASFGIPDEVVQHYTERVVLESPNEHFERRQAGAVLEFADFKRWLVDEARDRGVEYRFDAHVSKPVMEGGRIVGVEYNGTETVYGDIIIDATGPSAPLAKALDVTGLEREHQAIGIEFEFEGVSVDHDDYADLTDAMMLRLDHDIAPGGYSWIFHTGADTAKVGLCYIQNERYRRVATDGYTIDDYLEGWLETDPRFENATRIEDTQQHRGSAHIQLPKRLSTDNFVAIGDTVPTVDPLWGEGIDKCMRSGRAAAVTVDNRLIHDGDTSAEKMAVYDDLWHARVAPDARRRLLMTELLYLASNDRYDVLMRDLNRLGEDTLRKANEGNPRSILQLLRFEDLPLLATFARGQLASVPGIDGFA